MTPADPLLARFRAETGALEPAGTQTGPQLAPGLWRRFIKPRWRKVLWTVRARFPTANRCSRKLRGRTCWPSQRKPARAEAQGSG